MWRWTGAPRLPAVADRQRTAATLAERRSGEGMTTAAQTGLRQRPAKRTVEAVSAPEDPSRHRLRHGRRPARSWVEAGYRLTPTSLAAILTGAVSVLVRGGGEARRPHPSPASRPTHGMEAPDVVRGETQLWARCRRGCRRADGLHAGDAFEMGTRRRWPSHRLFHLHDRRAFRRHHQT